MGNKMKAFFHNMQQCFIMYRHYLFAAAVAVLAHKLIAAGLTGPGYIGCRSFHQNSWYGDTPIYEAEAINCLISSKIVLSLLRRGTLCWPPSLPFELSQFSNVFRGAACSTGSRRAISL